MPQTSLLGIGPLPGGSTPVYDVTANKLIFAGNGVLYRICVTTAGSANGTLYDSATVGGISAANAFFSVPDTVGIYTLKWPCQFGCVYAPGSSQVASLSFSSPF